MWVWEGGCGWADGWVGVGLGVGVGGREGGEAAARSLVRGGEREGGAPRTELAGRIEAERVHHAGRRQHERVRTAAGDADGACGDGVHGDRRRERARAVVAADTALLPALPVLVGAKGVHLVVPAHERRVRQPAAERLGDPLAFLIAHAELAVRGKPARGATLATGAIECAHRARMEVAYPLRLLGVAELAGRVRAARVHDEPVLCDGAVVDEGDRVRRTARNRADLAPKQPADRARRGHHRPDRLALPALAVGVPAPRVELAVPREGGRVGTAARLHAKVPGVSGVAAWRRWREDVRTQQGLSSSGG